jgi:hypothetical protein
VRRFLITTSIIVAHSAPRAWKLAVLSFASLAPLFYASAVFAQEAPPASTGFALSVGYESVPVTQAFSRNTHPDDGVCGTPTGRGRRARPVSIVPNPVLARWLLWPWEVSAVRLAVAAHFQVLSIRA